MLRATKAVNIKDFLDLIAPWSWIWTGRGSTGWVTGQRSSWSWMISCGKPPVQVLFQLITDHQHSWVQKQPRLDSSYLNQLMGHGDGNIGEQCQKAELVRLNSMIPLRIYCTKTSLVIRVTVPVCHSIQVEAPGVQQLQPREGFHVLRTLILSPKRRLDSWWSCKMFNTSVCSFFEGQDVN